MAKSAGFLNIIWVVLLMLALCSELQFTARSFVFAELPEHMAREIIVKYREDVKEKTKNMLQFQVLGERMKAFSSVLGLEVMALPKSMSVQEAIDTLQQHPDVLYAEPNYIIRLEPEDYGLYFDSIYGLRDMQQSQEAPNINKDMVVAILDTGLQYNHVDLSENLYNNPDECTEDGIDNDDNGYIDDCYGINVAYGTSDPLDDNGHGTHVASTITATVNDGNGMTGINYQTKMISCKLFDVEGLATIEDAIDCLDYVKVMKDRGIDIIATSNSWGTYEYSQALHDAIGAQQKSGILFITADGNDVGTPFYPCAFPLTNVICVRKTTITTTDSRGKFLKYDKQIVEGGLSVENLITTLTRNTYGLHNGTLMSSAHVSGAATLLKLQDPNRDWCAIKALILAGGNIDTSMAQVKSTKPGITTVCLAYQNIKCDNSNDDFSIGVSPGGFIVKLLDDGNDCDAVATDGIYSAQWIPITPGIYTFYFPGNDQVSISIVTATTSAAILVTTPSPVTLKAHPSIIPKGGNITGTWSGITEPNYGDWIGLFVPSRDNRMAYLSWQYTTAKSSGHVSINVPSNISAGTYELRLFIKYSNKTVAKSNLFSVIDIELTNIHVSPTTIEAGQIVKVTWNGILKPSKQDWIALFETNAVDTDYLSRQFTNGKSTGNEYLTIPSSVAAGTFELRLFTENSQKVIATSNLLLVTKMQQANLTVSPSITLPGDILVVTWSGIMVPTKGDWVGFYKLGAENTANLSWQYTNGETSGKGHFYISSSLAGGNYEMRLFTNNSYNKLATSNSFSVGGQPKAFLSASPLTATPGEYVTAKWNGIQLSTKMDWIGIFKPSTSNTAYLSWQYINGASSGTVNIPIPQNIASGNYELRFFLDKSYLPLVISNSFYVSSAGQIVLSVTPTTIAPGRFITASWSGIANPAKLDWIGLYLPRAADKSFIGWQYTNGASSGTTNYPILNSLAAGTYEIRLFTNNTYSALATSNSFSVSGQPRAFLSATPLTNVPGAYVTAKWSGIHISTKKDWIGLFKPSTPNAAHLSWQYTNGASTGTMNIPLPRNLASGNYELRFLPDNSYNPLTISNSFYVSSTGQIVLSVTPTTIAPGRFITASWSGIANPAKLDWIGLYLPSAADKSFIGYQYTNGASSGTTNYPILNSLAAGTYEIRLFTNNTYSALATSNSFSVSGQPRAFLSATPLTNVPGAYVTAKWSGIHISTKKDWIGLFKPSTPNAAHLSWQYTNGASTGTMNIPLPRNLASGNYELRFLPDNSYNPLTISNSFYVSSTGQIVLSVTPTTIAPGRFITASWSGIANPAKLDWIGLYLPSAADKSFIGYQYTNGASSGTTNYPILNSLAAGTYEIRLFTNNTYSALATSNSFSVSGQPQAFLSATPLTNVPGAYVTAKWSGIHISTKKDWIGLFKPSTPNAAHLSWQYTNGASTGMVNIPLPRNLASGNYELRFLPDNSYNPLAISNSFYVSSTGQIVLSVTPTTIAPGRFITASWSGIANPAKLDWIGLYLPSAADKSFIGYQYTNGASSGTTNYPILNSLAAGTYEIRLFTNNTYSALATSNSFSVSGQPRAFLSATPLTNVPGAYVTAKWSGIHISTKKDWIGLFKPSTPNAAHLSWQYTNGASTGTMNIPLPRNLASGNYELRFLPDNSYNPLTISNSFYVSSTGQIVLSVTPTTIAPGRFITASWSGIANPAKLDWIGLYLPSAADKSFIGYQYTNGASSGTTNYPILNSLAAGTYEIRLFTNNTYSALATSNSFSVSGQPQAFLSATPLTNVPGAYVTAKWSGIHISTKKDWIGLFKPSTPNAAHLSWQYTNGASTGMVNIPLPRNLASGNYELRFLPDNSYNPLAISNSFYVSSTGQIVLSVTPTTIAPGRFITASWSGIANPAKLDWIGLYLPSAADKSFLSWQYTNGALSGTTNYPILNSLAAGTYEIRLFTNNTYSALVTSNSFSVSGQPQAFLSATPLTNVPGAYVTAKWSGIHISTKKDWIGLFKPSTPNAAHLSWQYTNGASTGMVNIPLPRNLASGNYELRFLPDNSYNPLAISNSFYVSSTGQIVLSVTPTTIAPGRFITASWSGIANPAKLDWIGLYLPSAADKSFLSWQYTNGALSGTTNYPILNSLAAGTYEIRLFTNNTYNALATSNSFSVIGQPQAFLSASPLTATPGAYVTAKWNGLQIYTKKDWIGLFKPNASNTDHLGWKYTNGASSGTVDISIPGNLATGNYELRIFPDNLYNPLVISNSFFVTTAEQLHVNPTTIAPGGLIKFSWSGIANPDKLDWIGLYLSGAANKAYLSWQYMNGASSGTSNYPILNSLAAGTYEIRLFPKGTFNVLATSNSFSVTGQPQAFLSASPLTITPGAYVTAKYNSLQMSTKKDWIGLFKPNASNTDHLGWKYTNGASSGTVDIPIPGNLAAGNYELRFFSDNSYNPLVISNKLYVASSG